MGTMVMLRKPPEGRIQDNLRKYGTGDFVDLPRIVHLVI